MRVDHILHRFTRGRQGSVAVEFAAVATILIALVAVGIDLINISSFNREIERATTEVATMIASCPDPNTPAGAADPSCVTNTIRQYYAVQANALVRFMPQIKAQQFELQIGQINKQSGAIVNCTGNSNALQADVNARALAVMNDLDVAIAVVMSMTYTSFMPKITKVFTNSPTDTINLRGYTIAVQRGNTKNC